MSPNYFLPGSIAMLIIGSVILIGGLSVFITIAYKKSKEN